MSLRESLVAGVMAVPVAALVWFGAGGEEPTKPPVAAGREIKDAVERLGSPERATRIAAERELNEWGPLILERLPEAESVSDPAARAAVARIRKRLEGIRATSALRPTSISIEARGPAAQISSMGFQGGIPGYGLALSPQQERREIEISLRNQPYWKVVDEIAAQINAWPDQTDARKGLTLRDRTPGDEAKRIGYFGSFRLAAGPVAVRPVAGDERRRLVRVPLELRAEWRVRPLFASYSAGDVTLTTAEGTVLRAFTPNAKYELPFGERGGQIELTLDFLGTGEGLKGPLALGGAVSVTAAVGKERFWYDFDDMDSPTRQSHGGVTVELREAFLKPNETAEVELVVVYDAGGPAFESHRTWVYHNEACLYYRVMRDGTETLVRVDRDAGFDTLAQSDGGVVLRYRFTGVPPDAKGVRLEYEAPTKLVRVPVEVEIGGLVVGER